MLTDEYFDLIRKLVARTEAGTVNWHPTSDENQFVVYFDQFSLSVGLYRDEREPDTCHFTIRGTTGKVVDKFWLDERDERWDLGERLFTAARRKALRVDQAVETILRELDSPLKTVGLPEVPSKPSEDDDIPF